MQLLMIEATNGAYQLPEKGLVGNHAIFDPAVLDTPTLMMPLRHNIAKNRRSFRQTSPAVSVITYPFVADAVGWHGDCIVRLNWRDIRPLMSHRYHLPPLSARYVCC